jgi:hypothetical protein
LIGKVGGVPTTLAYADYSQPYQATMPFVATSNAGYSVRVGAYDSTAADTGAYTLRAQSCSVPVPTITDSVTHTDNLAPGDCTVPLSDFFTSDSSYVHLYAIHFDSGASRTIAFTVPGASLAFEMGGPGYDPYRYFPKSTYVYFKGITGGQGTFTAGDSGVYTMIVATSVYQATSTPYTMTIGTEVPAALHVTRPPTGMTADFGDGSSHAIMMRKRGR